MGLDRSGVWHPECDLERCHFDQAPDGLVQIDAFVVDQFRRVRIHVCASHRDQIMAREALSAASA